MNSNISMEELPSSTLSLGQGTKTSRSALLGLYPGILPPAGNLLVNELLVIQ